ncbi:MAG: hypothetical protein PUC90_02975 [Prevotella sp.]|nr:hypothetical protein [Prevotella sp.]
MNTETNMTNEIKVLDLSITREGRVVSDVTDKMLTEVPLIRVVSPIRTIESIPEGCTARFRNRDMGASSASGTITKLNNKFGYIAFKVVGRYNNNEYYDIHHYSRTESAEREERGL